VSERGPKPWERRGDAESIRAKALWEVEGVVEALKCDAQEHPERAALRERHIARLSALIDEMRAAAPADVLAWFGVNFDSVAIGEIREVR